MISDITHSTTKQSWKAILADYGQLVKFRLTFTVVLSSVLGYLIGLTGPINYIDFTALIIGGFLVVAASNGINQIIEKDFDKLMTRTQNRPIAQNRISMVSAGIFCAFNGIVGVSILALYLNTYAALLGFASLMIYAFVYTPMKRISSVAVLVGAFPGAIPPLLGWVAATGQFSNAAIALFLLQFFWQFPHFWAIAWILDDDYKKAGYRLLPFRDGRSKVSARSIILYSVMLLPLSALPYFLGMAGIWSMILLILASLILVTIALKLYNTLEIKDAKRLMFASIIYNPLSLIVLLLDKI